MRKRLRIHCHIKKKLKSAVALGRRGGKAGKGKSKARSSKQAKKAAAARWDDIEHGVTRHNSANHQANKSQDTEAAQEAWAMGDRE